MKEINKTVQDLKMEIEAIKNTQTGNPGDRKLRKENRSYRGKNHPQSTRDGKETLKQT